MTGQNSSPRTLILTKARVITMDPMRPLAEGLIIKDGRVRLVGLEKDIKTDPKDACRVIDCRGRTVLPGFIDAHFHLQAFAESLVNLNVSPSGGVSSIADIQTALEKITRTLPPGTWIRAGGYNEFYLTDQRHPHRWDLDQAAAGHPVKLSHRSGHAHVLNSHGLKITGISIETPDPPGGLIERDIRTGEPTGLLFGMGGWLADKIPPLDEGQLEAGLKRADRELVSVGLTAIQDASSRNDLERWRRLQRWKEEGRLKCRVSMMMGATNIIQGQEGQAAVRPADGHVRVGAVKIIVSQTSGRQHPSQADLNELVMAVHRSGRQAAIHAIEQESVQAACSAIEYALKRLPRSDHRHRIEHCSECPPALARRLADLGIAVVTQPAFIYYHGQRYLKTVLTGELRHLYPIATLMQNGVLTAAGSDCPIIPADPLKGIYAAVSRTADTGQTISPQEGVTPLEALKMYTLNAARSNFQEADHGSIKPGRRADLVVLDGDPTILAPEAIKDIRVDMTIINGEVVWERTPD